MNPAGRVRFNIVPIANGYSGASQPFLFARLTREEQGFSVTDARVRWASGRLIMETRYTVVLSKIAGAALGATALMALASGSVVAQQPMEKKGTTPYVTHFIFRPLMSDIPGLGTATNLEAVGPLKI